MNKTLHFFCITSMIICLCTILCGCSMTKDMIESYSSGKVQCYLNEDDITRFTYKDIEYVILNDTVTNENLGEWLGYIRQLVAANEEGAVLVQENIEDASFKKLVDLADKAQDAKYIIPFLNVYAAKNTTSFLIIDVNGNYHKAIPSEQFTDQDRKYDYKNDIAICDEDYQINPQNATQLLLGDQIYQITSEAISNKNLGSYLDTLAESVTFNATSKCPLTKEELRKIDWTGKEIEEQRIRWFYSDVYEILGVDKNEAIAVKINNQYYIAKLQ